MLQRIKNVILVYLIHLIFSCPQCTLKNNFSKTNQQKGEYLKKLFPQNIITLQLLESYTQLKSF